MKARGRAWLGKKLKLIHVRHGHTILGLKKKIIYDTDDRSVVWYKDGKNLIMNRKMKIPIDRILLLE